MPRTVDEIIFIPPINTRAAYMHLSQVILWAPWGFVAFLTVLFVMGSFNAPVLDHDETIYAIIASDLLDGYLPYQKTFDHKPIGIYYIYALFMSVFGKSYIASRSMSVILLGATLFLANKTLKSYISNLSSRVIGLITIIAIAISLNGLSGNTEVVQIFCIALIIYVIEKVRQKEFENVVFLLLSYGVIVSLGFATNYLFAFSGLLSYFAFAYCAINAKVCWLHLAKQSLLILIGFILGSLVIYSPFILDSINGGFVGKNYFTEQSLFLSAYQNKSLQLGLIKEKIFLWLIPFMPLIFLSLSGLYERSKPKQLEVYILCLLVSSMLTASLSLKFFNHYWITAALPLGFSAALCFSLLQKSKFKFPLVHAHCMFLIVYLLVHGERIIFYNIEKGDEGVFVRANNYIRDNYHKDEAMVSLSVTPAYIFTSKLNAQQKYLFPGHVEIFDNQGLIVADQYYSDLIATEPTFILAAANFCDADGFEKTCSSLTDYLMVKSFNGLFPVDIYERLLVAHADK